MNSHTFPENNGGRCVHCGTLASQTERTACPGPSARLAAPTLRPEPAERRYAVYDQAAISARLAELKADREAVWNTIEEETG